jgi:hypothetical protein
VLLFTETVPDLDDLRELHRFLRVRWGRRVVAAGFPEPALHRGVRVLPIYSADGVGGYLTKLGEDEGPVGTPGLELARPDLKAGRSWGSRAPFRILADHAQHRKPADWRLWEEWLHVAKGRRTLEWSRGLRAQVLPDEQERTDEELAEESEPAEEIAVLEPEVWLEVVRRRLSIAVLAAVEAEALGGLVVLLRAAGLDVVAAREGPRVIVRLADDWGRPWPRGKRKLVEHADSERLLSEIQDAIVRELAAAVRDGATDWRLGYETPLADHLLVEEGLGPETA